MVLRLSEKYAYYQYINVTATEAIISKLLKEKFGDKENCVLRRNVVSPLIVIFKAPQIRR